MIFASSLPLLSGTTFVIVVSISMTVCDGQAACASEADTCQAQFALNRAPLSQRLVVAVAVACTGFAVTSRACDVALTHTG